LQHRYEPSLEFGVRHAPHHADCQRQHDNDADSELADSRALESLSDGRQIPAVQRKLPSVWSAVDQRIVEAEMQIKRRSAAEPAGQRLAIHVADAPHCRLDGRYMRKGGSIRAVVMANVANLARGWR
jgi:hypothetical protein